jgi:hypothetical protein
MQLEDFSAQMHWQLHQMVHLRPAQASLVYSSWKSCFAATYCSYGGVILWHQRRAKNTNSNSCMTPCNWRLLLFVVNLSLLLSCCQYQKKRYFFIAIYICIFSIALLHCSTTSECFMITTVVLRRELSLASICM